MKGFSARKWKILSELGSMESQLSNIPRTSKGIEGAELAYEKVQQKYEKEKARLLARQEKERKKLWSIHCPLIENARFEIAKAKHAQCTQILNALKAGGVVGGGK